MEPSIQQPVQPAPIMTKPSKVKWVALGVVIIILIIGGGVFAYSKYMPDSSSNTSQNQTDKTAVSSDEQKAVELAFSEIAQIIRNHDLVALADYTSKSGGTPEGLNLNDNPAENDKVFDFMYKTSFEPLLDDADPTEKREIFNKKTLFQRGEYEDGEEYIEMVVTGVNSLDEKEASSVSIIHTFVQIDHKWYWVSFDFKMRG